MQELKNIVGIIAVVLTFAGYVPYIRDTMKGKTTPHVYTWFLWGLVSAIAFALQVSDGAGVGSFVTLAAAIVCLVIFILGLIKGRERERESTRDITTSDTILFIIALIAIIIWLFAKQPVISVILVSIIDLLSFVPTIRKSWNKPHTETLSSYAMNTFRFALGLFALKNYTIITYLYPVTWLVANGLFSVFLVVRRKQVKG